MSVLHVRHARLTLENQLCALIDMSDATGRSPTDFDQLRLSRALAAYSLMHLAEIDPSTAIGSIVDGFDDNGLDAVYVGSGTPSLWMVQAKWMNHGKGSPKLGDVKKFADGVRDLIEAKFDRFNVRLRAKAPELRAALDDTRLTVHVIVAYTGDEPSTHAARDLKELLAELNDPSEMAELHLFNLKEIHRAVAGGAQGGGVTFNLGLLDWGKVEDPHKAFYGQVAASEIAALWNEHGTKLVAKNLRSFMGETDVNEAMQATLKARPEDFWYFNNGITMLCDSVKKTPVGGSTRQYGMFQCTGGSIVNGAQTAGNIAKAAAVAHDAVDRARVLVRLLSLEHSPDGYAAAITRATNTQNRIERKDFVSLDPEQDRLRTELLIEGKRYVFKSGEVPVSVSEGCNLEEATAALACSSGELQYAIWSKKEIGKLWETIDGPPYTLLFNSALSGLTLLQLVVFLRAVDEALRSVAARLPAGRARNVAVHGNRLIAFLVFERFGRRNVGGDPGSAVRATTERMLELVESAAEKLFPEAMVSRLFYNTAKCRAIVASVQQQESVTPGALASGAGRAAESS